MKNPLAIEPFGEAFAHFILPPILPTCGLEPNIGSLTKALNEAQASWRHADHENHDPVQAQAFDCVAGQCDLLLTTRLDDFRFVADLQSRLTGSTVKSVSWVYCVPYRTQARRRKKDSSKAGSGLSNSGLRFYLYLRVRREFYRTQGIKGEQAIVEKLYQLIDNIKELEGVVSYSLGWPDLVVRGQFHGATGNLSGFLAQAQGIHVPSKRGDVSVFRKTLTLLGVPWSTLNDQAAAEDTSSQPITHPAVLVQYSPGASREGLTQTRELFFPGSKDTHFESALLDGKWDMRITPTSHFPGITPHDYLNHMIANQDELIELGMERTQTHFLYARSPEILTDLEAVNHQSLNLSVEMKTQAEQFGDTSCQCAEIPLRAISHLEALTETKTSDRYLPAPLLTRRHLKTGEVG